MDETLYFVVSKLNKHWSQVVR